MRIHRFAAQLTDLSKLLYVLLVASTGAMVASNLWVQPAAAWQQPPRPPATDDEAADDEAESARDGLPSIADKTAGMTAYEGFFTFFWDDQQGKIWLIVDPSAGEFLYATGLASGLGSNPIGLDRGQLGASRVVRFEKVGPRVFLKQRNLAYRSSSDNPSEQRAIADSFATSILWSADVAAADEGKLLVDASDLFLQDVHRAASRLGNYSLDKSRSHFYLPRTKAFPDNCEFEVELTFQGNSPGARIRETTPSPQAVTLRQHHSLIRLPDDGYQPRRFDPRVGAFKISYADYSVPIEESIHQHWITRHRLEKKDPTADRSEAVEPIVYYLDPGVPEPVRSALLDGARWWNEAFEAAGFIDAFQVRMLPDDADPMDVRYNVIQWVHRSTRGWSYGQSVIDPRTGEIMKGHVLLGSLRVRQDYRIIGGLVDAELAAPQGVEICNCCGNRGMPGEVALTWADPQSSPTEVALARIRQLSAHEVGHTIGFAHNFAASTYGDRASVMDYPAPRVRIRDDESLDLSDAYGVGIGAWDIFTVKYAYTQFGEDEDEAARLKKMVDDAIAEGLLYVSDSDARPAGAAHPLANLWDNGTDPVRQLDHIMRVREIALKQLDATKLKLGMPRSELEQVLVPIYLYHRYQAEAAAKMIGGATYAYSVSGDATQQVEPISADRQRQALRAMLSTLETEQLVLPRSLINAIPPRPYGTVDDIERFPTRTSRLIDPTAISQVAAEMTLGHLLQVERMNRLVSRGNGLTLNELLETALEEVWGEQPEGNADSAVVKRVVQNALVDELIRLAHHSAAHPDVTAQVRRRLQVLAFELGRQGTRPGQPERNAHASWAKTRIEQFLADSDKAVGSSDLDTPPGSPIGGPAL